LDEKIKEKEENQKKMKKL